MRARLTYIDLVGKEPDSARAELLNGINEVAEPSEEPPFPSNAQQPRFPGALPDICNLTHRRNSNFTGREEILSSLFETLRKDGKAAVTQAIHGLGGVGKTTIAIEYIYRHAAEYDLIWWLRSEETAALEADYIQLAVNLGIQQEQDQRAVIQNVRRKLAALGRWLLVFDNAEDPSKLKDYLPLGDGHVMITSRNPRWGSVAAGTEIDTWNRDESIDFLLSHAVQPPISSGDREPEHQAADTLAARLGDLPLALEQARAYVEQTDYTLSLSDYLSRFESQNIGLFGEDTVPLDYQKTITTTWKMALDEIGEDPAANAVLNISAFLAPDDIPLSLLRHGSELQDEATLERAIQHLRRYSLIKRSRDSISIHRLVQEVLRARNSMTSSDYVVQVADMTERASRTDDILNNTEEWPALARLHPHIVTAADHASKHAGGFATSARLLHRSGLYLYTRADFGTARQAYTAALTLAESAFGLEHEFVGSILNDLGMVLHQCGKWTDARSVFERSIAILETTASQESAEIGPALNNLGRVLHDLGENVKACRQFERAIELHASVYGVQHGEVGFMVNNLGRVYHSMGLYAEADDAFKRAIETIEGVYGSNHPSLAMVINNLGALNFDRGNHEDSAAAFERAIRIDEASYGADHPEVATDVNNLGSVLLAMGDYEKARVAFERASAIIERTFGSDHPNYALTLNNMAMVYMNLGDSESAKRALNVAMQIDEVAFGRSHPAFARDLHNLGRVLRSLNDLTSAKELTEISLSILRESVGDDHPKTQIVRDHLNEILEAMN